MVARKALLDSSLTLACSRSARRISSMSITADSTPSSAAASTAQRSVNYLGLL